MTEITDGGMATALLAAHDTPDRKPCDLIQFAGPTQAWMLNLDVDADGKHSGVGDEHKNGRSDERTAAQLTDHEDPFTLKDHFEVDKKTGTAVRFRAHVNGATTEHSPNPRTELREMQAAHPTKPAKWKTTGSTLRSLTAEVAVTRAPSTPGHARVAIGQIHTDSDDLLEIQYDEERGQIGWTWPDPDHPNKGKWQEDKPLIENYQPGAWFTYRIEVESKTVRILVKLAGQHEFVERARKDHVSESGCYFKAGAYTQSNPSQDHAVGTDYGEALFRSIVATGKGV